MHKHKKHNKRSSQHKDRNANQKGSKIIEAEAEVHTDDNVKDTTGQFENFPTMLTLKHSDVLGRYVVANRNIRAGEILFRNEEPVVVGPCQGGRPALCLGCCQPLELPLRLGSHCSECGWPMCSKLCPQVDKHRAECQLLKSGNATPLSPELLDEKPELYNTIVPLRCLYLRDNKPDKWKALMRMESHNEIRRSRDVIWKTNQEYVVDPIRQAWGLSEKFSEMEIHTICGILEVNGFEIGASGRSLRALFPLVFLMAHDCIPNTCHTDDSFGRFSVRAAIDITEGQSVTVSYAYTLQGTLKRRQHLRDGKFFDCSCARCSDPTEMGTYCSAFVCSRCKAPRVISTDPLNDDAPWSCEQCKEYSVGASSIQYLLQKVGTEAETIDPNDLEAFEEFLVKYSCVLPPSHYLMLGVKHSLTQLYGKIPGYLINDLSDELLRRKKDICKDVLPVFDVLEPGMSRLRGMTLYELHAPLMLLSTRAFDTRSILKQELQANMKEVAECLEKSAAILCFEPKGSSERSMAEAASQALKQVNEWRRLMSNTK